jgi:hypothetical protein
MNHFKINCLAVVTDKQFIYCDTNTKFLYAVYVIA